MDAELLARIQFAFTVGFHYIFPPISIGLSWLIFILLTKYVKGKDESFKEIAYFWIKLFGITFAIGVATGITMEFQFGTNWAQYSRFVGDIFGAPLAAEGLLAFFLESTFLGVLLYGVNKVSPRFYWFSSLLVAIGSTLSAFWIIVANSWQQTPAGFVIRNGRAELTNFAEAVFNPSTMPRYLHTVNGALITGAFFMIGISAWYLLKKRHVQFATKSLMVSLVVGLVASLAVLPLGHYHAVQVAQTQPTKMAAFEGLWETRDHAPLLLFGIPSKSEERTLAAIEIPSLLSILVGGTPSTVVKGLKDFPADERPPLHLPFFSFHFMVALGLFFIVITALSLYLHVKGKLAEKPWLLKVLFFSLPLPIICNEFGWIAAEVGRQPWIVQGLLKTKDAISIVVPDYQIALSLLIFVLLYAFLFTTWILLLKREIVKGPKTSSAVGGN